MIVTIVGDVRVPGVHEVELGTPLAEVIALVRRRASRTGR